MKEIERGRRKFLREGYPFIILLLFCFRYSCIENLVNPSEKEEKKKKKRMSHNSDRRTLLSDANVGFIGGGNMAKAIVNGLIDRGVLKSSQIFMSAKTIKTLESWKRHGISTTFRNQDVIDNCDVIILAVKPYQLDAVLNDVQITTSKLFISVLVGISCERLSAKLNKVSSSTITCRIVRVMPNLAVAVGEGCTVLVPDQSATPEDVHIVKELFSALGSCEEIPESMIESVAAVAGSGPAYIFMVIEALADGAVKHGVPRDLASQIAAQTVLGASKLTLISKKHPGQLKDEICSPGGTTICAVHELEKGNVRGVFMSAVEAAVLRAKQMKSEISH